MPLLADGTVRLEGSPEGALSIGNKALNFTRLDQNGNYVSLADFQGRPVALLCLSGLTNEVSLEKLNRFKNLLPRFQAAGVQPLVATNTFYRVSKALAGDVSFPVLDDESHSLELLNSYQQRDGNVIDYPIYLLDANHTITAIHSGDSLLDDSWIESFTIATPPVSLPPNRVV
jgi:peroxiredoxin